MIEVSFDIKGINEALGKLDKNIGLSTRDLIFDQMRLFVNDMITFTAPYDPGSKSTAAAKKVGFAAVERDVNKLFAAIKDDEVLKWYSQVFDSDQKYVRYTGDSSAKRVSKRAFTGQAMDKMRGIHQKFRRKNGRVQISEKNLNDVYGGKWLVSNEALQKYIKQRQKKVGYLKSGWVAAADEFARLSKGKARVPSWVRKQGANGEFKSMATMSSDGNGYVEAVNTVPYAEGNKSIKRWIVTLTEKRNKDINGKMKKRLKKIAEQFNKGNAA